MKIIDAHTHIFAPELIARRQHYVQREPYFGSLYANPKAAMADATQLLISMERNGVDQAVICGFPFTDPGLREASNSYILEASKRAQGRLIPFIVVQPLEGEKALEQIERAAARGARGIGELMPDGQGFQLNDPLLAPMMDLARRLDLPILMHVNERVGHHYAGKGSQGPEEAYRFALAYPRNRIILAHWGGGLVFYELMPEVRRQLRHVYYDTAASLFLYRDELFVCGLLWAPDKILFATDYPLISQRRFLERIRRLSLDPAQKARLLGGNAARLFGTEGGSP